MLSVKSGLYSKIEVGRSSVSNRRQYRRFGYSSTAQSFMERRKNQCAIEDERLKDSSTGLDQAAFGEDSSPLGDLIFPSHNLQPCKLRLPWRLLRDESSHFDI